MRRPGRQPGISELAVQLRARVRPAAKLQWLTTVIPTGLQANDRCRGWLVGVAAFFFRLKGHKPAVTATCYARAPGRTTPPRGQPSPRSIPRQRPDHRS